MLTRFEQFAVTELMGKPETPPRLNGTLCFGEDWQRTAFGIALALAKQGAFEWDDFRNELISEIDAWERSDPEIRGDWDYYACWRRALEVSVGKTGILGPEDLDALSPRQ